MTYRCIDMETTGIPTDGGEPCGIMEAALVDLRFGIIHPPKGVLVDCGIPVSIEARAVHHISDEMVSGEIRPDQAIMMLMEDMKPEEDYFCAHNIDFERKFFGGGEVKWICTYKTALRIWPEAPGHKLMELRYFLQLDDADDFDPKLAEPPHRARADAYVCAHLLRRILAEEKTTVEQLVRWSNGPALLYLCWMKKYKGTPWKDVPRDYLSWIVEKSDITDRDIRATAKYYLTRPSS